MFPIPSNPYARARMLGGTSSALREPGERVPEEQLLQAVWQHQRLLRAQLTTLDGRPVRVLHPGFLNRGAGPDFRGAVVQVGDGPPQSGDVEVDLVSGGWHQHGHDRNRAFQNVILHVIWDGARPAAVQFPTVSLRGRLDASLEELECWLGANPGSTLPDNLRGRCCAPLRAMSAESLSLLLHQAAEVRLQTKAAWFRARARHAGWEQALWEGLFRALGYQHNVWPMQRLAEMLPIWGATGPVPVIAWQARLLGASGLMPAEPPRRATAMSPHVRRLWDWWWRERDALCELILPAAVWRLGGLRPSNHPVRRLALAAHWLAAGDMPGRLDRWFTAAVGDGMLAESLRGVLQEGRDDFWLRHWTLSSPPMERAQPLLGSARVSDLAVNVILPWFWTRAVVGGNDKLRNEAERRYAAWPAAQDNARLRAARMRLFGEESGRFFRRACLQQGVMQILQDYCAHSNALCEQCRFPGWVSAWNAEVFPPS